MVPRMRIPDGLRARLGADELAALERLLTELDQLLPRIYREALFDYQESRGDDAALYGLRVYKHLRFALMAFADRDPVVRFREPNGAYVLAIGSVLIRVDSLGHHAQDDVLSCFPDSSPSKLDVGRTNLLQLQFEFSETHVVPDDAAYALNRLTVGHFGNPREGFVKSYLGAWTQTERGGQSWAWVERQDHDVAAEATTLPPRAPVIPFSERDSDVVAVRPRGA